jgi:N-acetylmuramoyl-L-alanine amidase
MDIRNGAPPYGIDETEIPPPISTNPYANWQRPEGPAKVALQVGHWKNSEFPDELAELRGNTGASAGGVDEWKVNLAVAELTANILTSKGVTVEILPATVPPKYWADAFIAIHADGSTNTSVRGFKIASPWRDLTDSSDQLVSILRSNYQAGTKLVEDPNITRNMRGYYAFSWWRFEHSIHPMTTAAIVETGFLTNATDRNMLKNQTEIPATALAQGILEYLQAKELM